MERTSPVPHLGFLDGLRGIAALFVVLNHAYLQVTVSGPIQGALGSVFKLFIYGRYSVDVFIVLSGFCLMLPIVSGDGTLRGGAWKFFQRRAWRILPTYYFALAFFAILGASLISQKTGTHWDVSLPVTPKGIVSHLLLIHDAVGEYGTINLAFWSIAVEWRIYFLFPLFLWMWRRLGACKTTVVAVVASYLLFWMIKPFEPRGLTAYYIGLFAMGTLGASVAFSDAHDSRGWKGISWEWLVILMTGAVLAVSFLRLSPEQRIPDYLQDGVVGLWTMCLLIMLSVREQSWLRHFLGRKLLVWLGTFAYSIYLVHAPLLQLLWQYVFTPWQENPLRMFLALSAVGTPLIVGFSYLFFLVCEQPFLRRKARLGGHASEKQDGCQTR